jgi:predicted MFS family arabinose efflux permease
MAGGFGMVSIIFARALSGVGQGFVFIGVQCYILCATGRESRTRGGSVIVIGFQAGMMAGMAIGSLLVSQLGSQGVFELGAVIAIITAFYTAVAVPYVKVTDAPEGNSLRQVWQNIALTLRDPEFLKAMWLIGLPAKAVLTGVVLFALPLLLAKLGYRQEDVGQITMSYGASVIAASAWVSARESKGQGSTGGVLVRGALFSGLGLLAISALGWQFDGASLVHVVPSAIIILAGAISVGIGHGFINAPVVTQVTHSRVSNLLGAGPVAATYRLLERGGHTAGPIIVSQVLAVTGSGTAALGWIGAVLITLGVAFAFSLHDNTGRPVEGVA